MCVCVCVCLFVYHCNSRFISVVVVVVVVVGRPNWPPPEFSKRALHDVRHYTLYHMNDPIGNF